MNRLSTRIFLIPIAVILLATTLFVTPDAAQQPETGVSPIVEAIGAMFITLVVGGGLILIAPEYTERTTRRIHDDPWGAFLYGFGIGIVVAIVLAILILTRVGILLAIPLALVVLVLSELGYLAVGRSVTDSWGIVLLVAVIASAIVGGVPIVGALLGFFLSSFGLGAAYLDYRDDERPQSGRSLENGPTDRSPPRR